jgi:hypothetical protein
MRVLGRIHASCTFYRSIHQTRCYPSIWCCCTRLCAAASGRHTIHCQCHTVWPPPRFQWTDPRNGSESDNRHASVVTEFCPLFLCINCWERDRGCPLLGPTVCVSDWLSSTSSWSAWHAPCPDGNPHADGSNKMPLSVFISLSSPSVWEHSGLWGHEIHVSSAQYSLIYFNLSLV